MADPYYPRDYQQEIDLCENIISLSSSIKAIDIPEAEDGSIDSRGLQKEIDSLGNDVNKDSIDLLDLIYYRIDDDINSAIEVYVKDIDNGIHTDQTFPFTDWKDCAKFNSKKNWELRISWLEKANSFIIDNNEKKAIYLENISDYLSCARNTRNIDLPYHLNSALIYINKLEEAEHFKNYLLFSSPYTFSNSLRDDQVLLDKPKGWSLYANILFHKELLTDKDDFLQHFNQYINSLENIEEIKKEKLSLISIITNREYSLPYGFDKNSKKIKWENLYHLYSKSAQINLDLSKEIIEVLNKHGNHIYSTNEKNVFLEEYKKIESMINADLLEKSLVKKDIIQKRSKI